MGRVAVFNSVTLDGYFSGEKGDIRWAHNDPNDSEWNAFVGENASGGGYKASWSNTKLVKGDIAAEVRKMKKESDKDMVILGSGSIVSQLTQARLIDEYQVVVNPIILGKGRTMFEGVKDKLKLKRTKTRTFGNGNVVLTYASER